jgi:DNA-binding beta-propeller fold protein YncE
MKLCTAAALLVLLSAAGQVPSTPAAESGYRVVARLEGHGVATAQAMVVDLLSRRLYAAREGGIDVYDLDAGKRVGTLALQGTPGGLELATDLKRGYVSARAAGTVTSFDLDTLASVNVMRTGGREPRELAYDRTTRRLYVSHSGSGDLVVLDAVTGRKLGALALSGKLRQSVADGRGNLFVADESANVLHVVDMRTLRALGKIPVWPGEAPTALANDTKERRIYVACSNGRMIIVDPDPGQMIGTVSTTGKGVSGMAMQVAPARLVRLFMPDASGRLNVIENAKLTATLERSVDIGARSPAVAFDDKSGRAYVAGDTDILVVAK